MRTAVTLDPDVDALLKDAMGERDALFKDVRSDSVRRGAGGSAVKGAAPPVHPSFNTESVLPTTDILNDLGSERDDRLPIGELRQGHRGADSTNRSPRHEHTYGSPIALSLADEPVRHR